MSLSYSSGRYFLKIMIKKLESIHVTSPNPHTTKSPIKVLDFTKQRPNVAIITSMSNVYPKLAIDIKSAFFIFANIVFSNFACTGKMYKRIRENGTKRSDEAKIITGPRLVVAAIPILISVIKTISIASRTSHIIVACLKFVLKE